MPQRPAGFTPGAAVPRFGFNPSMPPPGFALPPPGFGGPVPPLIGGPGGIRPGQPAEGAPSGIPGLGDRASRPQGPKQPEMMWPPDSNEMDEDNEDEDEEPAGGIQETNAPAGPAGQFGMARGRPPLGPDSPLRLMGPPPGGFPPGVPGPQPWSMNRMGGPRHMRGMGPRGMGGPADRFGSPRGPRMGGPQFMQGPRQGFQRPPGSGPVSLLDLPDIRPNDSFTGERFNGQDTEDNFEERKEADADTENNQENTERDEENPLNAYPHNTWSVTKSSNRQNRNNRDDERNDDREKDRYSRDNRDNDRDRWRDREDRGRDRDDRGWGYGRDRDSRGSRDRDRGRDRDGDRDWDRRDRGRDRERTRKSRWGDADDVQKVENVEQDTSTEIQQSQNSGKTEINDDSGNIEELVQDNLINSGENILKDNGNDTEKVVEDASSAPLPNTSLGNDNLEKSKSEPAEADSISESIPVEENKGDIGNASENVDPIQSNGPVENETTNGNNEPPSVENTKVIEENPIAEKVDTNVPKSENMDLEEGEISS